MEIVLLVIVGAVVGVVSALFGIGGGLLMVPFMVLVLGFDQHLAQGTSLAVIIPTAVAGALAHHKRGFVDLRVAVLMAVGGIGGVYAGTPGCLGDRRLDAPVHLRIRRDRAGSASHRPGSAGGARRDSAALTEKLLTAKEMGQSTGSRRGRTYVRLGPPVVWVSPGSTPMDEEGQL